MNDHDKEALIVSLQTQLDEARAFRDECEKQYQAKINEVITHLNTIDQLKAERDAVVCQRDNLLCRIHRDGGHYIQAHGIEKACEDADEIVANLNVEHDEIDTLRTHVGRWEGGMNDLSVIGLIIVVATVGIAIIHTIRACTDRIVQGN